MYGVNTGFGALADTPVGERDLTRLQGAMIRSHAAGSDRRRTTPPSARCCCCGCGRSPRDIRECGWSCRAGLLEPLEWGLLPVIPGKGSVGASGDLAQLAHLAQPLIGEGRLRTAGGCGRPRAPGGRSPC